MTPVERLSEPATLWFLFAAVLVLTALFPIASSFWGITFVDSISDPDLVRETISAMSSSQRSVHAWLTSTLDVAYPLAYGAFFLGSAHAYFPNAGRFLAIPAYLVIPVDLAEGVVQVLALADVDDWLELKAVLTPLKTGLFLIGLLITVCGWFAWLYSRVRRKTS